MESKSISDQYCILNMLNWREARRSFQVLLNRSFLIWRRGLEQKKVEKEVIVLSSSSSSSLKEAWHECRNVCGSTDETIMGLISAPSMSVSSVCCVRVRVCRSDQVSRTNSNRLCPDRAVQGKNTFARVCKNSLFAGLIFSYHHQDS